MSDIDFADLDKVFNEAEAMLTLLYTRAREDIAGAVLPGQSYEPRISGAREQAMGDDDPETVPMTSVEQQVLTGRLQQAKTYRAVVGKLRSTVKQLVDFHGDITPTGDRCRSRSRDERNGQLVECERLAVRNGLCGKCWPHVNAGQPPDAPLLREWNGRLERDCECTAEACEDVHAPGRCVKRIKPGDRARSCGSCRNRRSSGSTTGTGGAFEWQEPA